MSPYATAFGKRMKLSLLSPDLCKKILKKETLWIQTSKSYTEKMTFT